MLDNIRSAQNVGSILRTCDALGIKEVILCGLTPGIQNEKVQKTSLGAENNLKISYTRSTYQTVRTLREKGIKIGALELAQNAKEIQPLKKAKDWVLVIGNEVSGVDAEVLEMCDEVFMIPMQGIKESLNVSVAFGIAAYVLGSKKACDS